MSSSSESEYEANGSVSVVYGPQNRECLEQWRCTSCDRLFITYYKWIDHIQKFHMDKLICEKCNLKFTLLTDIIQHLRNRHLQTLLLCTICDHAFCNKVQFTTHECQQMDEQHLYSGLFVDADNRRLYADYYRINDQIIFQKTYLEDLPDYESIKRMMDEEAREYERWCKRICSDE